MSRSVRTATAALSLVSLLGCGTGQTETIGVHDWLENTSGAGATGVDSDAITDCNARPVEASNDLDPFYSKLASARGILVMASASVDDAAVRAACEIVVAMLADSPAVAERMVENSARVAIMAQEQSLRDLPEFSDLGDSWERERGQGASMQRPTAAAAEACCVYPATSTAVRRLSCTRSLIR